jgi:hypothetical protein
MGFADFYLQRFSTPDPKIIYQPPSGLKFIVVIPAYNEPDLIDCLDGLFGCNTIQSPIEVIIVINWPESSTPEIEALNRKIYSDCISWGNKYNSTRFTVHPMLLPNVAKKVAGVGFARKYGMDEAVRRFNRLDNDGIIVSFDADAVCDSNFFQVLEKHFEVNERADGCCIYFEHPIAGNNFAPEIYKAITFYELHLRYYYQGLKSTSHPNTFHTIGSAFAVRAISYCLQGGMNTRKAGEDFYFLQKYFELGNITECKDTRVIPSPRPSDRVPFGTGPKVQEIVKTQRGFLSYNPELFFNLKFIIQKAPSFYRAEEKNIILLLNSLDDTMISFLLRENFIQSIQEINNNSSSLENFMKRFFRWFNMFRMLKYLNFAGQLIKNIEISIAAKILYEKLNENKGSDNPEELLLQYRELEKNAISPR